MTQVERAQSEHSTHRRGYEMACNHVRGRR